MRGGSRSSPTRRRAAPGATVERRLPSPKWKSTSPASCLPIRSRRTTAGGPYGCGFLGMPPVLLVPDCRLMSQWIDGFLLVVAAHRTPRKLLGEALSAMDEAKVLGIVFNGDDRPLSGYYGGDYRSYYH